MGLFGRSTEAIGLFIDGRQVQAAHLRAKGSNVVLVGLEMATLVHPLQLNTDESDPVDEIDEGEQAAINVYKRRYASSLNKTSKVKDGACCLFDLIYKVQRASIKHIISTH